MGLLSDPSIGSRNQFTKRLEKHTRKICALFYVAGLAWFVCLAHPEFNHDTYLSENALSPGLVYPEMNNDASRLAQSLTEELIREREQHPIHLPVSWLVAKMKQIGLETHVHNFTLRYPYEGGKEYHGQNVYGILRAPRVGSTEGVVFAAPYRAPNSVHTDIVASVPTLLAFADFARKKNYWAKDLVFVVTEQEQLGMYAWLEAYHRGGDTDDDLLLRSGNLLARAGSLQAAINIEVQDLDFDYLNVKVEGLNGQLPNLDMFNLVQRIALREGIVSGYKQTPRKQRQNQRQRKSSANLMPNLKHMTSMLLSQAPGVPTANHGFFLRYRIESVTLEAVKRENVQNGNRLPSGLALLKTLEGISRSLNNLLERFHQSFFFYILVQNDRFVSIGDYMPCLGLLVTPLFVKAFLIWLKTFDYDAYQLKGVESHRKLNFKPAVILVSYALLLGLICNIVPTHPVIRDYCASLGIGAAQFIGGLLCVVSVVSILLPIWKRLPKEGISVQMLHVAALLSLAVSFIVIGLLNFALGFSAAIISVPLSILVDCELEQRSVRRLVSKFYAILLHPLNVVYLIVLLSTIPQFPESSFIELIFLAARGTIEAITITLMDWIIYGNWLYRAVTLVFLPIWTCHWALTLNTQARTVNKAKGD